MQAGSELSAGLGTPESWNRPEAATRLVSGAKVQDRKPK
jgi:hypothetical protein